MSPSVTKPHPSSLASRLVHSGHWLGGLSIVVAESEARALSLVKFALVEHGLPAANINVVRSLNLSEDALLRPGKWGLLMGKTVLADWEKKYLAEKKELDNWRGRRLRACRACDDPHNIIEKLGFEDGSELPSPMSRLPHPPSDQMKAELQNQVAVLLRMILINNDGSISPRKLPRF